MQGHRRLESILLTAILLGCAAAHAQGTIVATPSELDLDNTTGSDIFRTVTLTTTSTTPINITVPAFPTSWLTVKPNSGTVVAGGPFTLTMEANAAQLDTGSTYNILVPIISGGQTILQIQVYFNVQVVTGLTASPSGLAWTYAPGGASPPQQPISLGTSASSFSATVSANAPWLALTVPNAGPLFSPQSELGSFPASQGFIIVFDNLGQGMLTPGMTYTGAVTVTDSNNNVAIVTVSLNVLNTGTGFTVSQPTLQLASSGAVATGTVQLQATNPTAFTATTTVVSPQGGNWLSATQSGTAPQTVTITANPANLSVGTYSGSVTFVGGTLSAVLQVTFVVSAPSVGGGNVVSDHASLNFGYVIGNSAPSSQTINITDQSGTLPIPFTVSAGTSSGGAWLTATVAGGANQGVTGASTSAVIVTVNPAGLPASNYSGTVNITPSGGNVFGIPVTLVVTGTSTVTATPLQLSFSYQTGAAAPAAQQIQVSGNSASLPFTVVTATQSGGNWLSASSASGTTPATVGTSSTLNISVSPTQLGPGSYQGTVTIAGSGGATGSTTVQVSLSITSVLPSITSVVNAASFLGGPASPGEIVTIFGSNLGPATPAGTTLDSTGKVSTSLGGVQVLFNGTAAPLTYVSATQINCVVPYEFAQVTNNAYVQVKYQSQTSNIFNLQPGATNPAIFTTGSGTGQGAILNGDNSSNAKTAAAKGSTIQLYLTGEGLLSPAQATGSVTCSAGCASISQIPKPAATFIGVMVNNQPATFTFAGEAPGFVSGVLQMDVTIPANTPTGAMPIVVTIGSVSSQSGVTVQVQ